jgi:hypothetical protein
MHVLPPDETQSHQEHQSFDHELGRLLSFAGHGAHLIRSQVPRYPTTAKEGAAQMKEDALYNVFWIADLLHNLQEFGARITEGARFGYRSPKTLEEIMSSCEFYVDMFEEILERGSDHHYRLCNLIQKRRDIHFNLHVGINIMASIHLKAKAMRQHLMTGDAAA